MANLTEDPPLVDVKVTNPVTYLKRWWAKIIGNEGMSLTIKVKPLTTIFIFAIAGTFIFGVGRFVWPEGLSIPFFEFGNVSSPTPTPQEGSVTWKETAYIGTLKYSASTDKFFLITRSASEAITLEVPENLNLTTLVEKRIMVIGKYSKSLRVIQVFDAKDMEVLPNSPVPIPTNTPTSKPTVEPTENPTESPQSSESGELDS